MIPLQLIDARTVAETEVERAEAVLAEAKAKLRKERGKQDLELTLAAGR